MSLFGSILEKLGLKKKAPPPAMTQAAPPPVAAAPVPAAPTPPPPPPPPVPMAEVDVISMLEGWASQTPQKLNWRTSIVDLMKLLGMESSLSERKELATELGCPAEYMNDSARMNVWLHKEVLRQIAKNGGNVPAELYD
jgi:3-oxoacyl-ACP reductase-like protein